MKRWMLLAVLFACRETDPTTFGPDAMTTMMPDLDAASDTQQQPMKRTGCLDRPVLERAPSSNRLPCELIPPGVTL